MIQKLDETSVYDNGFCELHSLNQLISKGEIKWLYLNVKSAVPPRKEDANQKNAPSVLKQEPCRKRKTKSHP
jgi:hypothetical protein